MLPLQKFNAMEITHHDDGKKGIFEAKNGAAAMGEMTYVWAGANKIIIDHTGVEPAFEGQGVGTQLVMAAVALARQSNLKILPLCPFAKAIFMRKKEIGDVLA
jgi:predicted GNAT family acetyltransferase